VPYQDGDVRLTGFLAWDESAPGTRPGVLLIHGGGGLDDHARDQARRYAGLGYAVLAGDMFGEGVAGDRERTMALLASLRDDPDRLVQRGQVALRALGSCPEASACRGAVGFCFGGMAVLTLARSGADLPGVVSMHGALKTDRPARPGVVRARVLACHGALDPHVPRADVDAFIEEMDSAEVDYQLIVYGGAMHGFTHTRALPGGIRGVEYHERTDRRSFAAAQAFFAELAATG